MDLQIVVMDQKIDDEDVEHTVVLADSAIYK